MDKRLLTVCLLGCVCALTPVRAQGLVDDTWPVVAATAASIAQSRLSRDPADGAGQAILRLALTIDPELRDALRTRYFVEHGQVVRDPGLTGEAVEASCDAFRDFAEVVGDGRGRLALHAAVRLLEPWDPVSSKALGDAAARGVATDFESRLRQLATVLGTRAARPLAIAVEDPDGGELPEWDPASAVPAIVHLKVVRPGGPAIEVGALAVVDGVHVVVLRPETVDGMTRLQAQTVRGRPLRLDDAIRVCSDSDLILVRAAPATKGRPLTALQVALRLPVLNDTVHVLPMAASGAVEAREATVSAAGTSRLSVAGSLVRGARGGAVVNRSGELVGLYVPGDPPDAPPEELPSWTVESLAGERTWRRVPYATFRQQSRRYRDLRTFLADLLRVIDLDQTFMEGYHDPRAKARFFDPTWYDHIEALIRQEMLSYVQKRYDLDRANDQRRWRTDTGRMDELLRAELQRAADALGGIRPCSAYLAERAVEVRLRLKNAAAAEAELVRESIDQLGTEEERGRRR